MIDRQRGPGDAEAPGTGRLAPRTVPVTLAVPWGLRQVLWGVGLTVVPLVALLVATQTLPAAPASAKPLPVAVDISGAVTVLVASVILEGIFLIAPLYFALKHRPADTARSAAWRLLGLRRTQLWRAVLYVLIGYAAVYGFGALYGLLHIPTNADTLAREAAHAPITTMATLLVAFTVAPFTEEIFFRGFVLPGLARAVPVWAAVVVSALVFGLAHADLGSFLPLFAIGIVLGIVRWRLGSTWPGMALHALNNGIAAVVIVSMLPHR